MSDHNVVVYSTPTCHYCVLTKEYFKEHNVEYKDINVGEDRNAVMEMVHKSGQMGVPVVEIDGQITVGFQPNVFAKQLGLN